MNDAETKAFAELVAKVEKLEKSLDLTDLLLKACFTIALAAGGGTYRTLAEMRTLVKASGQKTDDYDTLITKLSDAFKNASTSIKDTVANE